MPAKFNDLTRKYCNNLGYILIKEQNKHYLKGELYLNCKKRDISLNISFNSLISFTKKN